MLEIILLFFVGRYFYRLADDYNQNKWLYAVIGIVCYFAAALVTGVILGVADAMLGLGINWDNSLLMTIIALPVGLGACYGLYLLLKRNWEKSEKQLNTTKDEIQDIGKSIDELDTED